MAFSFFFFRLCVWGFIWSVVVTGQVKGAIFPTSNNKQNSYQTRQTTNRLFNKNKKQKMQKVTSFLHAGERGLARVHSLMGDGFEHLGKAVAKAPWLFLIASALCTLAMMAGFSQFASESRTEKLWVPQGTQALTQQDFYRSAFGSGVRRQELFFAAEVDADAREEIESDAAKKADNSARTNKGYDALTSEQLKDLDLPNIIVQRVVAFAFRLVDASSTVTVELDDELWDIVEDNRDVYPTAQFPDRTVGLANLCVPDFSRAYGGPPPCLWSGALAAWGWNATVAAADPNLLKTLSDYYIREGVGDEARAQSIGGLTTAAGNTSVLQAVRAMRLNLFTRNDEVLLGGRLEDLVAEAWEEEWQKEMLEIVDDYGSDTGVDLATFVVSARFTGDEFSRAIFGDLGLLGAGCGLIVVYLAIVLGGCGCCFPNWADHGSDWTESRFRVGCADSRILLSLGGVATVGLAIGGGIGMGSAFGLFWGPVNSVLPFLILGIGVDDIFIMVNAMRLETRADRHAPIRTRLARAYGEAGVSVTITSVTDILAFGIGSLTTLPALSVFSLFAALTIFILYCMLLAFFGPILLFDFMRQEAHRADVLPCFRLGVASVRDSGESDPESPRDKSNESTANSAQLLMSPAQRAAAGGADGEAAAKEMFDVAINDNGKLSKFFGAKLSVWITQKYARIGIIALTLTLVGLSAAGASQLRQEFSFRSFIPADSVLQEYFDYQDWYFGNLGSPLYVVTVGEDVDHFVASQPGGVLDDVAKAMEENDFVPADSVDSWHIALNTWLALNATREAQARTSAGPWSVLLKEFLATPQGSTYVRDVVFNNADGDASSGELDAAGIYATRMTMRLVKTNSSKEEVEAMQTTRTDVADATDDEAGIFPFTFGFVFTEQYVVIELEAVQNLSLALGAALLVVMFMLGNLGLGALTFVCILFTIVDILGLMWAWGVAIDGVSVVNLVLAIGLAVDYSVHIAHGYAAAPHQLTRRERVHFSLATMGSSVFNGGVSTFIAVLVLAFSQSYIFIVFFKQFFGIVIFGLFHGLVFLPAILSLIGPQGSVLAEAYESHELKMHAEGDDSSESHTTSTSGETPPPAGDSESGSSSSESDSELSSEVA